MTRTDRRRILSASAQIRGPGVYSRRRALQMLLGTPALMSWHDAARCRAASESQATPLPPASLGSSSTTSLASLPLGILKIRHSAFLLELAHCRIGVDLCFAQNLNFGPFFFAAPTPLPPESVGRLDLLLFSSARGDHFDVRALERVPDRNALCLVPEASMAKRLRNAGFQRVQVVRAAQQVAFRGMKITMSPSADLWGFGEAVGFHVQAGTRSIWHMGAPPPLDIFPASAEFAKNHPTEVVLACADGQALWGRALGMALEDATLLAALARARIVIPQHDDAEASPFGQLFFERSPIHAQSLPPPARLVSVEPNIWYRIRAPH